MSNPNLALAESVSTTNASYFIIVYLLILIYCCFGLAVVCDVYFVPALQKLSLTYDLPPDIAGSTLMALGASVPELFASLIGVFITEDDIGTGSIIGSSCFNLIAVPAACAFVASATFAKKLTISPMPIIRNSAFYAVTILVLVLIIKDNKVDIPEALILLLFFVMYMAFMIFSAKNSKNCSGSMSSSLTSSCTSNSSTDSAIAECHIKTIAATGKRGPSGRGEIGNEQVGEHAYGQFYFANDTTCKANQHQQKKYQSIDERTPLVTSFAASGEHQHQIYIPIVDHQQQQLKQKVDSSSIGHGVANMVDDSGSVSLDLGIAIKNSTCLVKDIGKNHFIAGSSCALDNKRKKQMKHVVDNDDDDDGGGGGGGGGSGDDDAEDNWVRSNWILVPILPLTLSMKALTPCKFKNTCWTIWTFLVSIALIGGLTYVSVWMVHLFGQSVGIPETVAGMTVLSWGTGIPELIASIVLIKKTAQADMAICNTIGSNVIDLSFCLSLPWIVKCIMNRTEGLKPQVAIQSAALPWTSFTLLVSVLLLLLILKLHDWVLGFSVGVWLLIVYVAFVSVATYLESTFSQRGLDLFEFI